MSMSLKCDSGSAIAGLRAFRGEVTNAIYAGAQAAAEVFYREAKLRAPVSASAHWFHGTHQKYLFRAGTLRDSIYQVQSKDNSSDSKAVYHVSWNHQKCPYGFMVEYGTSRAPAHPFLRPAYEAAKKDAISAAKHAFADHLGLKK